MVTFRIIIEKHEYTVNTLEEKDQVLYEVYDDDLLCVLGFNENGEWEANNETPENIVYQFGKAIEEHEA